MPTSSLDASFGVMLDACVIYVVTYNLKHFPVSALASHDVEAQHPDAFLMGLYDLAPSTMVNVIVEQAAALKRHPMTTRQVLARLEKVGMTRFAHAVRTYLDEDGTE